MTTASQLILARLQENYAQGRGSRTAVHELNIVGVSQNAAATRLSEMAKLGRVGSQVRPGKRFKEWWPL